jgi:hypothetical protein
MEGLITLNEVMKNKIVPILLVTMMVLGVLSAISPGNDDGTQGPGGSGSSGGATLSAGNHTAMRLIESGNYTITEDSEGFHRITMSMPGYWDMTSPGNPTLPQKLMEIGVPQNIDWSTVEMDVIIVESIILNGSYNIAPSPPLEAEVSEIDPAFDHEVDWGYDKIILDGKNILVYENNETFPEEPVDMMSFNRESAPHEDPRGHHNL